jgi:hypothetical protein
MSRRTSIIKAITAELNLINGTAPYKVNLFQNAYAKLRFWDEVKDFPSIYLTPGTEMREYHPGDFTWGFLNVCIKVYCHGEASSEQLEDLLADVELCIDKNRQIVYDATNKYSTTEILIQSITTDEGLLAPYAVGEVNLQVRYQVM